MTSSAAVRLQIEAALADRNPSALTPRTRSIRPQIPTGIVAIDELLSGGFPVGAITELTGPECSGRTTVALSFLARITESANVCAWIDVSDALQPESAAAAGIDLSRLLWVRCGVASGPATRQKQTSQFQLPDRYLIAPQAKKGLHGGGFGPHPRSESKGLSDAVTGLFQSQDIAPQCAEPQRRTRSDREPFHVDPTPVHSRDKRPAKPQQSWNRLDQALRVTDLLLQAGGFKSIVLDMGSIRPEHSSRVPLATWFRYRAAAERTQTAFLLLTQCACTNSSAELLLRFRTRTALQDEASIFTGMEHCIEVQRQRFVHPSNVVPIKKPSQRETPGRWKSKAAWAGIR